MTGPNGKLELPLMGKPININMDVSKVSPEVQKYIEVMRRSIIENKPSYTIPKLSDGQTEEFKRLIDNAILLNNGDKTLAFSQVFNLTEEQSKEFMDRMYKVVELMRNVFEKVKQTFTTFAESLKANKSFQAMMYASSERLEGKKKYLKRVQNKQRIYEKRYGKRKYRRKGGR